MNSDNKDQVNPLVFILIIQLLLLFCVISFSFTANAEDEVDELYIGNIISDAEGRHNMLFVEKSKNKVYLLEFDNGSQTIIDVADILLGGVDGDKLIEGDRKTPEGVYRVTSYMSAKQMLDSFGTYASTYGTGAYPINYPNPVDRIRNKTGYGIWVHGLNPGRHKPATDGCVGLQNDDLDRFRIGMAIDMPVVIVQEADRYDLGEYQRVKEEQMQLLDSYIYAWNHSSYDVFKEYIHPEYSSYSGRTAVQYLTKKKYLMEIYPERLVEVDNVTIYTKDKDMLVYEFDQLYCADNLISYGHKRFYLINDDGDDKYKLISEEMSRYPTEQYMNNVVSVYMGNWVRAWESKDIEKYMKYYGENFGNIDVWEESKTKTFENNGNISVTLKDVKWRVVEGNTIDISFIQEYRSDLINDNGKKTLRVKGCPGSMKIVEEIWSKL